MHDATHDPEPGSPTDPPAGPGPAEVPRPAESGPAGSHQAPPAAPPGWQGTAGPPPVSPPPGWQGAPRQSTTEGFFASIRRTGMVRTDQRWVGGVAGGVARRLGVDPALVRCVWVVVTLLTGLGLIVYGLGWALMPDERDGRVHLEQALTGDVDAGLAGAIAAFIAGIALLDTSLIPHWPLVLWDSSGLIAAFWAVLWTGVILCLVLWLVRRSRRARSGRHGAGPGMPPPGTTTGVPASTPPPAGWQHAAWAEGAMAAGARGAQGAAPATDPAAPPAEGPPAADAGVPVGAGTTPRASAQPGWAPPARPAPYTASQPVPVVAPRPAPPRPRVPGPGRALGLVVGGLIFLTIAGLGLADRLSLMHPAVTAFLYVAGITALLGLGVIISGLRGRRGGWMTGAGWLAASVCLPLIAVGSFLPPGDMPTSLRVGSTTLTWQDISAELAEAPADPDAVVDLKDYAAGDITLDLSDMPAQALGTDRTVRLQVGAGTVTVLVGPDQPVVVDASVGAGQITTAVTQGWILDGTPVEDEGGVMSWNDGTTVDGEEVIRYDTSVDGTNTTARLVSPAAQDATGALTVSAEVGTGMVTVSSLQGVVTWEGNADETVWIVEGWTSASGRWSEAVEGIAAPGMTHSVISDDRVEQCLERAWAQEDADPEDNHGLSLSTEERARYDECVNEVLASGRGVSAPAASANPTATAPSAEPSPAPSGTPTPAATASNSPATASPTATS
ncbi:MAG: PspC domain-containing protein [Actinomyces sp.]|uniref:PspC domain-containing protein n=1 Tax=Actinomyces sp. TaxID=29317 RepID=UPI0026DB03ED|nr:PspC domain-containing protein [Actinomyces sp.]MDO4242427.1 PspC domain-containing protein [Actinomyces sp.]